MPNDPSSRGAGSARERPDPVRALLRLRRAQLDASRRALAACLAEERAAELAAEAAETAIARERAAAAALDADDGVVEAFGAWLPRGRAAVERADEARARAEAATGQARKRLAAVRAGVEATERLLLARAEEARAEAGRKLQASLDEAGQAAGLRRRRLASR